MQIPFNIPTLTGKETEYVQACIAKKQLSTDGFYTKACENFLEQKYGFAQCLLTTSCTSALEICAIVLDIQQGDEVILPSYTFVSTANAFALRGANLIFADSETVSPNIDAEKIEKLITPRTKAIVVVHYAGIACQMDKILSIAKQYNLFVVEDAAQCIDAYGAGKPLGSLGHLGAISFDQTKNITCGVGGALFVNDKRFQQRAEIIRTKGTNRGAFFRGEVDKYGWVDVGSAFAPTDMVAAFLYAQLQALDDLQEKRLAKWSYYYENLCPLQSAGKLQLPYLPPNTQHNAHIFYVVCHTEMERNALLQHLRNHQINAVFHYISLHSSPYWAGKSTIQSLPQSDRYTACLLRLPIYAELTEAQQKYIVDCVHDFFTHHC
jgi:dTDP-4-amino-4,6-dideoxygalactose transaminase